MWEVRRRGSGVKVRHIVVRMSTHVVPWGKGCLGIIRFRMPVTTYFIPSPLSGDGYCN